MVWPRAVSGVWSWLSKSWNSMQANKLLLVVSLVMFISHQMETYVGISTGSVNFVIFEAQNVAECHETDSAQFVWQRSLLQRYKRHTCSGECECAIAAYESHEIKTKICDFLFSKIDRSTVAFTRCVRKYLHSLPWILLRLSWQRSIDSTNGLLTCHSLFLSLSNTALFLWQGGAVAEGHRFRYAVISRIDDTWDVRLWAVVIQNPSIPSSLAFI